MREGVGRGEGCNANNVVMKEVRNAVDCLTLCTEYNQAGIASQPSSVCTEQSLDLQMFKEARNRFQGINSASQCSLAGRYIK